jgi:WD40 repeat protein
VLVVDTDAAGLDVLAGDGQQRRGVIRLSDIASAALRLTLSGHGEAVHRLAFRPDGWALASLGHDNVLNLWHLGTG